MSDLVPGHVTSGAAAAAAAKFCRLGPPPARRAAFVLQHSAVSSAGAGKPPKAGTASTSGSKASASCKAGKGSAASAVPPIVSAASRSGAITGATAHANLLTLLGCALLDLNFRETLHLLHLMSQLNFFGRGEQRYATDIAEIPTYGVGAEPTAATIGSAIAGRTR